MARKELRNMSGKLLNPTERRAISKLMKLHQPILKGMEKWKENREKLETALLDQIGMIEEILQPYYEQSKETLVSIMRNRQLATGSPNKKTSSRKKSPAKKSSSRKASSKKSR